MYFVAQFIHCIGCLLLSTKERSNSAHSHTCVVQEMEQLPHTKQELLKAESTKKPYLRVDVARTAAFIAAGRAVETERGDDALINGNVL